MDARPADRKALLAHIRAHPVEGSVAERRTALAARLAAPEGLGAEARLHGHPGLMFGEGRLRALFLHGGGYVLGSPRMQAVPADRLARELGGRVFAPRYPLAPEAAWPAPLEAVLSLLDALEDHVALVGSSAGGHLALVAALQRPGRVSALALFSPNTDRTGLSSTREANTPLDAMNSDAGDRALWREAMPEVDAADPDASPVLGELSVLPPVFLSATEGEVLLGDTLVMARALEAAGVPHEVRIAPYARAGMHMFESWPDALPEGRAAIAAAARFLRRHE